MTVIQNPLLLVIGAIHLSIEHAALFLNVFHFIWQSMYIVTGSVGVFMLALAHERVHFIILPCGSITTSVIASHKFICVTSLSDSPHWYYNNTLLPGNRTNKINSFMNFYNTGNYTCSVNKNDNYTVTLTSGLLYKNLLR